MAFRQTMGRVHRAVRSRRATGSSRPGTPRPSRTAKTAARRSASRTHRPSGSPPIPSAGCCTRARRGTASRDLEDDYCMLDPIKVSIVTPGVADKGGLDKRGIPATPRDRRICTIAASRSRRPPTSRSCSCSRSASRRGSGARCSTRCSTSSATTTATRRSLEALPGSSRLSRIYGGSGFATSRTRCSTSCKRVAADALARRGVLDAADADHDAERRLSAPGARRDRARAARGARRPRARHERGAVPARHPDADAGRVDRRRTTDRISATCARCGLGTSASRGSATTRTASRTATARYFVQCLKAGAGRKPKRS